MTRAVARRRDGAGHLGEVEMIRIRGQRPAMTIEHSGDGFAIGSWIECASEEPA